MNTPETPPQSAYGIAPLLDEIATLLDVKAVLVMPENTVRHRLSVSYHFDSFVSWVIAKEVAAQAATCKGRLVAVSGRIVLDPFYMSPVLDIDYFIEDMPVDALAFIFDVANDMAVSLCNETSPNTASHELRARVALTSVLPGPSYEDMKKLLIAEIRAEMTRIGAGRLLGIGGHISNEGATPMIVFTVYSEVFPQQHQKTAHVIATVEAIEDLLKLYQINLRLTDVKMLKDGLMRLDVAGEGVPDDADGGRIRLSYTREIVPNMPVSVVTVAAEKAPD